MSNFGDAKSKASASVRDQQEDDFDLEDFTDIAEAIQLQGVLEEKRRQIRKIKQPKESRVDKPNDNFLINFLETNGDFFKDFEEGSPVRKQGPRIAKPPTKEEVKKNQLRLH